MLGFGYISGVRIIKSCQKMKCDPVKQVGIFKTNLPFHMQQDSEKIVFLKRG